MRIPHHLAIQTTMATMKKAPGAITIMVHLVNSNGRLMPATDPNPKPSLMTAMSSNTMEYPTADDTPSISAGIGLFWIENASTRPKTMQFVIMRPTYGPN